MSRFAAPVVLAVAAAFATVAGAMGAAHSKVATDVKKEGSELRFTFKVIPDAGLHITKDGPWTLTVAEVGKLAFKEAPDAKGNFPLERFDPALPGFRLTADAANPAMKKGKLSYKLRAFVCNDDKTRCYPELHTGTVEW